MPPYSLRLPPDPALQAILLVTRSRVGPRLVLHYPPQHHANNEWIRSAAQGLHDETDDEEIGPSDASTESELDDIHDDGDSDDANHDNDDFIDRTRVRGGGNGNRLNRSLHKRRSLDPTSSRAASSNSLPHLPNSLNHSPIVSNDQHRDLAQQSWDTVMSWSAEGLAKMLAPTSRKWHKKRFELCMEEKCFLGCPMFEKEEGGWGHSKAKRRKDKEKDKEEGKRIDEQKEQEQEEAQGTVHAQGEGDGLSKKYSDDSNMSKGDSLGESESSRESATASAATTDIEKGVFISTSTDTTAVDNGPHTPSTIQASTTILSKEKSGVESPQPVEPHSLASTSITSHSSDTPQHSTWSISLTMFNLVFVTTPAQLEHQARVKEMYDNVVKTFAKALKHLQREEGYVWKEARYLSSVREKARESGASHAETWATLASKSSLAKAIATTFDKIRASDIAHINLGPFLDISLQIPEPKSTPFAPTPIRKPMPGLQLTSFSPTASADDDYDPPRPPNAIQDVTALSPFCAVLLLHPPEKLVKDFLPNEGHSTIDPSLAGPLTYFIKHVKPTKTLVQMSRLTRGRISLADIQLLAQHLIHYRCAIAIPPLHPSQIYIPSPNAEMRSFREASAAFSSRFVSLPSLPALLAKMGRTLQPYSTLIPSSDHKEAYMEMLAWMVRGGWLTQLRTFAWVYVSREVKATVETRRIEDIKASEAAAALAASAIEEEEEHADLESEADDVRLSDVLSADSRASGRKLLPESGIVSAFSPRLRAQLLPARPASQTGSTSSGMTAVPVSMIRETKTSSARQGSGSSYSQMVRKQRLSDGSAKSLEETNTEGSQHSDPASFEPSIILSPHKANAQESRWLEEIGASLPDEDVRIAWPKLLKYFDGKHAIEEIAMQEALKRKVVTPILMKLMGDDGVLRMIRHW